jgi:type II secretory pathway pseudopilin PulG
VAAAATLTGPGDQAGSSSYAMPLLIIVALILLGVAGVYLRRFQLRRRVAAVRREREATWGAVVHQIEMRRALGALEPSAEPLQKADAA